MSPLSKNVGSPLSPSFDPPTFMGGGALWLSKILPYMDTPKQYLLLNAIFFMSRFSFFLLVYMCHRLTKNNKIDRLHGSCWPTAYSDRLSAYGELFDKDSSNRVMILIIQWDSIKDSPCKSVTLILLCLHQTLRPGVLRI